MIIQFFLLITLLDTVHSQLYIKHKYAYNSTLNFILAPKNQFCKGTDYLINSDINLNAYFINCTSSPKNYITLNNNKQEVSNCDFEKCNKPSCKLFCAFKCLISFDLYYQDNWENEALNFQFYNVSYNYYINSSNTLSSQKGFCDNKQYSFQQINITHTQQSLLNFTISTPNIKNNQAVSIRNIYILDYQFMCHPTCSSCTGPIYNQCQNCFYGNPQNQICPLCPANQYYVKYKGCYSKCNFIEPLCLNGFCNLCSSSLLYSTNFNNYTDWIFWSNIYNQQTNVIPSVFWFKEFFYGIFIQNSGISRYINEIIPRIGYYIGIKIQLIIFNELPLDSGIHIKFNRTYYGSIYNSSNGIKQHNFTTIYCNQFQHSYLTYENYSLCDIYGYFDIPQYPFLFSAVGNLSNSNVGWAMRGIQVTSDYCTDHCLECDVSYKCKTCEPPYLQYRDGTCILNCQDLYQQKNSTYCKDFDDETKYSELLISENINYTYEYNSQYNLISSTGVNFLKGSNIHYSFWNGFLIFGGSYVWAQAKFERIYNINKPHHSISIAFYILYGSQFPDQSQFIYSIDQNQTIIRNKSQANIHNQDGTFVDIIQDKLMHFQSQLNITFECKGDNNEPINAFCGLYNFYLAVHYCPPYCDTCIDWENCTQWNRTDYLQKIQFSQSDCRSDQYFDIHTSLCKSCPSSCISCNSEISCSLCKQTYKQTNLGCFCEKQKYEADGECKNCPSKCNQCLSNTQCFECIDDIYMTLDKGVCNCIDKYQFNSETKLCEKVQESCSSSDNNCGNKVVECNEECDDQNNIQDDGCNDCRFQCQSQCTKCIQGKCYECEKEWYVDPIMNICKEKCGDFIKLDSEQCEISFILPYKGCQNCKQQCQSSCLECSCKTCKKGYSLIDNLCYSICGDYILTDDEQCDDGNLIYGDGCHFCQYSCLDSCQNCINGICQNYLQDHPITKLQCQPTIGKEIDNNSQLCNMIGNLYLFSDLYDINFSCDINCQTCFFKKCQVCNHNYILSVDSQKCIQKTPLFDSVFELCLIKIDRICLQCYHFAYFDITEQKCKLNHSDLDQCQINMIQKPEEFCNQCFQNCMKCFQNRCTQCNVGYYLNNQYKCISKCGDEILTNNEQCEIHDLNCQNCEFLQIQYCQYQHLDLCLQCQQGFYYNHIKKLCESICGDGYKALDEDCEDVNTNLLSGCSQCKYFCSDGCQQCVDGNCISCITGYILVNKHCYIQDLKLNQPYLNSNQFLQSVQQQYIEELVQYCLSNKGFYIQLAINQCISICGDGIISMDEQCDDKFSNNSFSCVNCKFQCPINCLKCEFGFCIQCIEGFFLSKYQCHSICGDQIIKQDEICDDNNNVQFDGCYNCQNSCQLECLVCNNNKCLQCLSGWILHKGECQQICGDGHLAVMSNEQCDDLEDMNCRDCQLYQCIQNCKLCNDGYQCLICHDGFQLNNNNTCQNQCGDGLIIKEYEECDDGNEIQYDGCYNCKYSCSIGCLECQANNVCLLCNEQELFKLDDISQQCLYYDFEIKQDDENHDTQEATQEEDFEIPQIEILEIEQNCGNSKLQYSFKEECDDGNIISGDGCSESCIQELSFKCKNQENQKSECTYIIAPDFILNLLSNPASSLQIIDLTFSQEIKLNETNTIEDIANFSLQPDIPINLTIIPIINLTNELNTSHYQLYIQFDQSVANPKFTINFKENSILNSDNISLSKYQQTTSIGNPFVLSISTQKKVSQIISMNDAIMYSMITISSLSIILGNPVMFFNLLDLLQSFSYIRYVQYQFPPHFQQFLETYSKISLKLFLDFLQIDKILASLGGGDFTHLNKITSQKNNNNNNNELNQTFLVNSKSCYVSVLISYLTYLIYKLITSKRVENFLNQIFINKHDNLKILRLINYSKEKYNTNV